jgi:hypothetical protein
VIDKLLPVFQITLPLMFTFVGALWVAQWAQNKRFDDVNKRFDDVNRRFDDLNRRFDGRFDELTRRLDEIVARLGKIEALLVDQDKRITVLENIKWR